ncbi:PAS domain-containing sensor histidine kinase [Cytophaga aurantiaca]|uniref:PAS domain-containing sensor histidine kinase n=1 Tax=Cytophaga aurantiaca TaxID=29530 RepID=UPI00036E0E4F|nr:PAS domain-containing sensor histidine kinase [Cytophaga aurantiaca]
MELNNIQIESSASDNQDIIFIINEDYIFLEVIAINEDLLYKKKSDIIGFSINAVFDEDKNRNLFSNLIKNTLVSGKSITIKYNLTVMAGVELFFEAICYPFRINFDGKRSVMIHIKNITEKIATEKALQKSETNFRSIYETTNVGIAIKDDQGYYIAANKAFENILGYTEAELKGIHFTHFISPEDLEAELTVHKQLITNQINKYNLEKKFITKSGEIIWGNLNVAAITDIGNKTTSCISVLVDVTERRTHEEKLMSLNTTKDKFFSIISHDIQNPLIGIIGLGEILKDRVDTIESWERDKIIRWIIEGSQTARNLLINLSEWSRSQSNQIELHPTQLNLFELVENNIAIAKNLAEYKRVTIENKIPEYFSVWIDINILNTIIRNLITNAIKFSHSESVVEITIATEGNECIVSVRDFGIGMTPVQLEKLFIPTKKVSTLGTSNERGTGLGLILCKEFIDKYNGKIWVKSSPNEGSTISFTIPMQPNPDQK